jgi:chromosomal replication initiation ATPase DnaA
MKIHPYAFLGLDKEDQRRLWKPHKPKQVKDIDPLYVLQQMAEAEGYSLEQILSKTRTMPYVDVRRCFIYYACCELHMTAKGVGRIIGKDHSTIIYARESAKDLFKTNPPFKRLYKKLVDSIKHYQKPTDSEIPNTQ